ncbi:AIPR family protein [Nguyenibacter vanlangensis]|uniref:AIPR family protein n=1 Tax=Nguyenibacter vanlangensis TaxID=1216886 RepID=A0A7Y7M4Z8_9PROT|nr:AIPR family protein [Nguyenibacter vanlangensis]NVN10477.1 AIPR family protein [Nguyenibacter vanlangensis]
MSEDATAEFARTLAAEIEEARDDPAVDLPSTEALFTRTVIEALEEIGHFEAAFDLAQEGRVGRSPFQISGYAIDEDAGHLTLFATHYSGDLPPRRVPASELLKTAERASTYVAACIGGLADRIEPSNTEAGDLARRVASLGERIDRFRIMVLTDGIAGSALPAAIESHGKTVGLDLYDMVRLHRVLGEGQTRADIDVNLLEFAGHRVACLPVASEAGHYEAYLAAFPGEAFSRIYDRYGTHLLELNVRAFLGLSGRKSVNAELRRTLVEQPEMFLAFNNGVVATADEIRLEREGGAVFLTGLRGLQIVNGGQTIASLHRARRKESIGLGLVEVPIKIIRVTEGNLEEMVSSISRAANRQNAVQQADFSANDPFHREVETLANNSWLESGRSRWFYERARGSWLAAEQKASYRTTEQRAFREQTPKARRFGKLELARYLSAWDGFPWRVAFGGQKNFQAFMQRRKEQAASAPDAAWFRRLIALTILYRTTERLVRAMKFPAYGANIAAYLVAALGERAGGLIDFDLIWRQQCVTPELEALINAWAPLIDQALRTSVGSRNPTEWFKKEDCWVDLRNHLPSLTDPLPSELIRTPVGGGDFTADSPATGRNVADHALIQECMRVPSAIWIATAEAGQRSGVLRYKSTGICIALANYAAGGWRRRPSVKQAKHGLESVGKVRAAGLFDEDQREAG